MGQLYVAPTLLRPPATPLSGLPMFPLARSPMVHANAISGHVAKGSQACSTRSSGPGVFNPFWGVVEGAMEKLIIFSRPPYSVA